MRISCTTLESFRLYMQPDQDWMSEQAILDTIAGKFEPNAAVLIGSAFGKVLEDPDRFAVPGGFRCGGYSFDEREMTAPLALMDRRYGVYEAKASRRYGACDVVAKADQLVGAHLYEHKTTLGYFDFEKYADSYQWRFMLDIFEADRATYHVFLLDDHENGVIGVRGIESFHLYPYVGLHADCQALLDDFTKFVTAKGLGRAPAGQTGGGVVVPVFHGYVTEDVKLILEPREQYLRRGYLKTMAGKPVDVIVKVHRNQRSDKQNRWHWGVAIPLIAQELGYDKHEHESLHYALVNLCFGTVFDPRLKQEVPKVRSSQLNTEQFGELMEWEVRWAATEYGINVPLPGESD